MLLVLARRLANIVPTLLAVIALIFLLFSVLPGQLHLGHVARTAARPSIRR